MAWTYIWKWYQPLNSGEFTTASAGFACSFALCCNWSLPHSVGRREFQSWALTSPALLGEILLPTRKQGTCDSHLLLRPLSSHWGQTLADYIVPGWELLMQQVPLRPPGTRVQPLLCAAVSSLSLPMTFAYSSLCFWADFQCVIFSNTENMPAAETIISPTDCSWRLLFIIHIDQ